jgi:hypothetical protein
MIGFLGKKLDVIMFTSTALFGCVDKPTEKYC